MWRIFTLQLGLAPVYLVKVQLATPDFITQILVAICVQRVLILHLTLLPVPLVQQVLTHQADLVFALIVQQVNLLQLELAPARLVLRGLTLQLGLVPVPPLVLRVLT